MKMWIFLQLQKQSWTVLSLLRNLKSKIIIHGFCLDVTNKSGGLLVY